MNKYKFVLKGKDDNFSTEIKGDIDHIISATMQFVCEVITDCGVTKKEFLEGCKNTYENVMKYKNERGNK